LSGTPPSVNYTPAANFCGVDRFTFVVTKAQCPPSEAVVEIQVSCVNDCPTAEATVVPPMKVMADGTFVVIAPDNTNAMVMFDGSMSSDPDGDAVSYAWFEAPPPHGSVVPVPPGKKRSVKKVSSKHQVPGECTFGKVVQLKLQYFGTEADAEIGVVQHNGDIIYYETHNHGDTFTITGTGKEDEFGKEIVIWVNGDINAGFDTSGTKPIGPGMTSGDFLIVSGLTKYGTELCELAPPPLDETVQFGDGVVAERQLFLGVHKIVLDVADASCKGTDEILVEVITASDAVDYCMELVNNSTIAAKDKRPLLEALKQAGKEFDNGKFEQGIKKLEGFIKKVQDKPDSKIPPDTKEQFIACAQFIIDSLQ